MGSVLGERVIKGKGEILGGVGQVWLYIVFFDNGN